ncbi:leucine-rich repeat domain-containing protein [Nonomuraea jabiensis]|uniref:Leucine-rich repeat (LRR) protein n=1 Tax=Nonomuraea jabiensis TaxID=882448 RepID=A0A7W9LAC8_9ACTN|nr:leucine-rich repeat domain-containing protein [Nonomuraea jabiensis]MBB5776338.1 Leucine-rich repeat (LRR) protein [Nonomuraea jabiensis]
MSLDSTVERRIAQALTENADVLDLAGLRLERVPESVRELTGITQLRLRFNLIVEVPIGWESSVPYASLAGLSSLEELDVSGNNLDEVPEWAMYLVEED